MLLHLFLVQVSNLLLILLVVLCDVLVLFVDGSSVLLEQDVDLDLINIRTWRKYWTTFYKLSSQGDIDCELIFRPSFKKLF